MTNLRAPGTPNSNTRMLLGVSSASSHHGAIRLFVVAASVRSAFVNEGFVAGAFTTITPSWSIVRFVTVWP